MSSSGETVVDDHVAALKRLTGTLARVASGGSGAGDIGDHLIRAFETFEHLCASIDAKEVVDFGLAKRIADAVHETAIELDYPGRTFVQAETESVITASLKVVASRLLEQPTQARNAENSLGHHMRAYCSYREEMRANLGPED